jgi:hypothetical protein
MGARRQALAKSWLRRIVFWFTFVPLQVAAPTAECALQRQLNPAASSL